MFAFGKKASEHYVRCGCNVAESFENVSDDITVADVQKTADEVSKLFIDSTYDRVYIGYTTFISTFEQTPVVHQMLPLDPAVLDDVVKSITPSKGKESDTEEKPAPNFYTIEPNPEEVLNALVPKIGWC